MAKLIKQLDTLIEDIEQLLVDGIEEIPEDSLKRFGDNLGRTLQESLLKRKREPTLRMSNIGRPCEKQLWYEINMPEASEELRPENYLKFMYGHLVEELVIFLAELAGHEVTGRQDEFEIENIKGHRDAVIDGELVDVKSASTFAFKKFTKATLQEDDAFGYIPQLQSYLYAAQADDLTKEKTRASFVAVDKTLGHITRLQVEKDNTDWSEIYRQKKEMVKGPIPERGFKPVPFGQSGNMTIGINCSYCPFKRTCWPEMRTFLYAHKPVDLVVVTREPKVPELGKEVENIEEEESSTS